jgi:hypothetical protein
MSKHQTLTSRNIGETENALRAILMNVLAGTGLDYPRWIALQFVSLNPSPVPVADVIAQLMGGLKIDERTADGAVADLRSRHILVVTDGRASVTESGATLYQQLRDRIAPVTQELYGGLEVDDLIVARRVLAAILERANAVLANRNVAA